MNAFNQLSTPRFKHYGIVLGSALVLVILIFATTRDEVAFTLSLTRSTRHIEPLLKDFEGVLLTDGYEGLCFI